MTKNLKKIYDVMMDDLARDMDERYLEFLNEKPDIFIHDNLIFDIENLDTYYDCKGCKKNKREAFCCTDHDLELTNRDFKALDKIVPKVAAAYPKLEKLLEKEKYWEYGDEFEKIMRKKQNGDCVFLIPGARGCYLHGYAIDNGLDPLDLKPYVCTLYPVVVIVLNDVDVVITTMNQESMKVLECSEETESCAAKRGKKQNHALVLSKQILTRMFGEKVYQKLHERVFGP